MSIYYNFEVIEMEIKQIRYVIPRRSSNMDVLKSEQTIKLVEKDNAENVIFRMLARIYKEEQVV